MLDKYATRLENLSPEQDAYLTRAIIGRHPSVLQHGTPEPTTLRDLCDRAGLDHADVVMSLSRDATVDGVVILEALIGKAITREAPKPATTPRTPKVSRTTTPGVFSDTTRITEVGENPKKPGSASHARFALYRAGMTVAEALAAGVTKGDVRWDMERGHIKLED